MAYNPLPPLGQTTSAQSLPVVISNDQSAIPVSGTFYQATQPVSIASTLSVAGTVALTGTASVTQSGTWNVNVSATALPLMTGLTATSTYGLLAEISRINARIISTVNSSTTPLGIGATFTGTAEDVTQHISIGVFIGTDQNGTLYIDFSTDGTNWDQTESYPINVASAGSVSGFNFQLMAEAKYYRIRYTNGATGQGVFRLQTIIKTIAGISEIQPMSQTLTGSTDAMITKGVIVGLNSAGGGTYVTAKVTPSGAMNTALGDISGIVGQTTMASSIPVVISSDQSAIPVTQSGTWNVNLTTTASLSVGNTVSVYGTVGVTGTVAITANTLSVAGTVAITGTAAVSLAKVGQTTMVDSFPVVIASNQSAIPVTQSGTWNVNLTSTASINAVQSGTWNVNLTSTASINVNITTTATLNVGNTVSVYGTIALTGTSNVAITSDTFIQATASSVTLFQSTIAVQTFLSANPNRKGAYFYNDGNQTCYLKLGSQASATSYTVKLIQDAFYELPAGKSIYTGIITGTFTNSTTTGVMVTEVS